MSQKYGSRWQAIPARTGGDWGIEGFVRPDGLLLQSYATDGRSPSERTTYQKAKLTGDIQKLRDNSSEIQSAMGELVIHQYVSLLPTCDDKSVIQHGERKAELVRGWGLPWIAEDFHIVVQDFDFVRVEYEVLHGGYGATISLSPLTLPDEFALSALVPNVDLLANLERKLTASPRLRQHVQKRNEWERRLVLNHARAEHLKSQLGEVAPELADRLQSMLLEFEQTLIRREFAQEPAEDLRVLGESLRDRIRGELRSLRHADADEIAFGAVADWLLRYPLEYVAAAA